MNENLKAEIIQTVRTVEIDGELWFVGKDVCEMFGDTNYRRSLSRIENVDKGVSQIETNSGKQKMTVVNESGLYSLLLDMQPEKARGVSQEHIAERVAKLKKLRRWVTSEVLPSVRKRGAYVSNGNLLDNPDLLINMLMQYKERVSGNNNTTSNIYRIAKAEDEDDD